MLHSLPDTAKSMKRRRASCVDRNGERERILIRYREALDKPQARQAFGGFRGAALNQSRSASGVYTGLICYGGVVMYGSASCGWGKMRLPGVSATCR